MWKYIIKRVLLMFFVIFGATFLTFLMMYLAPGDPGLLIAQSRYGTDLTPEQVQWVVKTECLDAPFYIQYLKWLEHTLFLDFGRSLVTGKSVSDEILDRLPATLLLAITSLTISLIISIPLGIYSAKRSGTWKDRAVQTFVLVAKSIPSFYLGPIFILIFSVWLGLLPSYGFSTLSGLILPSLTLALGMCAITTRLLRSSILEVMSQEYVVAARAKGFDEEYIMRKHILKNSLLPLITFAGLQMGYLLGGAVVVETVFSWPGIGKLLADSISLKDFPMIQGCALVIVALFCMVNLVVDILYAYLDPRVRYDAD